MYRIFEHSSYHGRKSKPIQIRSPHSLRPQKGKDFFISHLDKIYAAKAHLVSHLPTLADEVHFADLRLAILETMEDVEKQKARMEIIYSILDVERSNATFSGLAGLVDDAFADITLNRAEPELRDLSIAFYMQNIESMEASSFQILLMAAVKLKNNQIKQLIKENYDEAREGALYYCLSLPST